MYESTAYIISKCDTTLLYIVQDSTVKKQLPTDKNLLFKAIGARPFTSVLVTEHAFTFIHFKQK
jgi:hypothetical protein